MCWANAQEKFDHWDNIWFDSFWWPRTVSWPPLGDRSDEGLSAVGLQIAETCQAMRWDFVCFEFTVKDKPQRVFGMGCRRQDDCIQGHISRTLCPHYFKSCPRISSVGVKLFSLNYFPKLVCYLGLFEAVLNVPKHRRGMFFSKIPLYQDKVFWQMWVCLYFQGLYSSFQAFFCLPFRAW